MTFFRVGILAAALTLMVSCASSKKMGTEDGVVQTGKEMKKEMKSSASADRAHCMKGSDHREIAVVQKGEGCELEYTKFGNTNSVASSAKGNDYCKKVQERIKGKLEAAGYSCR